VSVAHAIRRLADGQSLTREEARAAVRDLVGGQSSEAQKGALLLGLASRGERAAELAGTVEEVRERMTPVPARRRPLLDTCGTGGDGASTFNVSTAAAFVCAGAGLAVAKHGNRSVSSRCGSADVLEELGVPLEREASDAAEEIDRHGFAFLFAPAFHPAMREVAAARRELGVRTIFNLAGPLANPAGADRQLIGVGKFEIARLLAEALAILGTQRAVVFHSENGLDELTPGIPAIGFDVRGREATPWRFDPGVLAQRTVERSEIAGGDAAQNAELLRRVLEGEPGPRRETVLLNAAAALWVAEAEPAFHEAYERARASIDGGAARKALARAAREEGSR